MPKIGSVWFISADPTADSERVGTIRHLAVVADTTRILH